ncbi:hypothetical protein [Anabaena sp. 4-3]|uniref:hypothetical protein n=1 Tax=Anabaena sp. 4-3 TaxID=1811979 RepID=UPI000836224C|nr:hypothetical protein [Anabaena sp. 4-3]
MENDEPVKIINTNLEDSEIHFYSFTVMPYEKSFFGYSPSAGSYTIHLTDKRLIVEPDINAEFLEKFYKFLNFIPFEGAGVYRAKYMNKEAIKKMYYLKYTFISINYGQIENFNCLSTSFNTNLVNIVLKPNLNERNLNFLKELGLEIFKPFPTQEIKFNEIWKLIDEKGLKSMGMEFIEYINKRRKIDSTSDFISSANFLLQLDKING